MKLFRGNKKGGFWAIFTPAGATVVVSIVTLIISGFTAVKNAISPPSPAPFAFLNNPWIIGGIVIVIILFMLKK